MRQSRKVACENFRTPPEVIPVWLTTRSRSRSRTNTPQASRTLALRIGSAPARSPEILIPLSTIAHTSSGKPSQAATVVDLSRKGQPKGRARGMVDAIRGVFVEHALCSAAMLEQAIKLYVRCSRRDLRRQRSQTATLQGTSS